MCYGLRLESRLVSARGTVARLWCRSAAAGPGSGGGRPRREAEGGACVTDYTVDVARIRVRDERRASQRVAPLLYVRGGSKRFFACNHVLKNGPELINVAERV